MSWQMILQHTAHESMLLRQDPAIVSSCRLHFQQSLEQDAAWSKRCIELMQLYASFRPVELSLVPCAAAWQFLEEPRRLTHHLQRVNLNCIRIFSDVVIRNLSQVPVVVLEDCHLEVSSMMAFEQGRIHTFAAIHCTQPYQAIDRILLPILPNMEVDLDVFCLQPGKKKDHCLHVDVSSVDDLQVLGALTGKVVIGGLTDEILCQENALPTWKCSHLVLAAEDRYEKQHSSSFDFASAPNLTRLDAFFLDVRAVEAPRLQEMYLYSGTLFCNPLYLRMPLLQKLVLDEMQHTTANLDVTDLPHLHTLEMRSAGSIHRSVNYVVLRNLPRLRVLTVTSGIIPVQVENVPELKHVRMELDIVELAFGDYTELSTFMMFSLFLPVYTSEIKSNSWYDRFLAHHNRRNLRIVPF